MEDWVTIRNLKKKNPELGTRTIAGLLGISRNTVKKALKSEVYPQYNKDPKINEDIKPFEEFIKESYLIKRLRGSRILKDISSKGYKGSSSAFYRYIEKYLKPQKESANNKAFMPYATFPGEQMQYDWTEYTVFLDGMLTRVYIHLLLLGYSRKKIFNASATINQSDVFEALEESFVEIGGVCSRIQVDNAKVFITNASKDNLQWNKRFLDFCGFYGIQPTRSLPSHPWSKGKVEKPFDYLETHFIKERAYKDFEDLLVKLKKFQEEYNNEVHSITRRKPNELFGKNERERLLYLPINYQTGEIRKYIGFKEEFRKVHSDCLISYGGNKYSVPHYFVQKEVWVRVSKGIYLNVYSSKNILIATHKLSTKKGEVIINKDHYKGYRNSDGVASFLVSSKRLKERFEPLYPRINEFINNVKVQKRVNPTYNLYQITRLFEHYSDEDCIDTMESCFKYNVFSASFIRGSITQSAKMNLDIEQDKGEKASNLIDLTRVLEKNYFKTNIKRDLKEYQL